MSKQTTVITVNELVNSSAWQRPQVRRIAAGSAEGAAGGGPDNVVFS